MGARQYYIHKGDMFVTAFCRDKVPVWYNITCIVQSLPDDKYQTLQIAVEAATGAFKISPRIRSRLALLYSTKCALTGIEYEDLKLRFLVECGTTLEGKIKEAVARLRKYPNRYRIKMDPDAVLIDVNSMRSKQELRRK